LDELSNYSLLASAAIRALNARSADLPVRAR
jgi:hypothetical protein